MVTCDGWIKSNVSVMVFMCVSNPWESRPISLAQYLIPSLPSGTCLRVPHYSVTQVMGSMTAKASELCAKSASLVVESWFAVMRKTMLFYAVLDRVKGWFLL